MTLKEVREIIYQGHADARAIKVGDEWLGAWGCALLRGYDRDSEARAHYTSGWLGAWEARRVSPLVSTYTNHIITLEPKE